MGEGGWAGLGKKLLVMKARARFRTRRVKGLRIREWFSAEDAGPGFPLPLTPSPYRISIASP
jgi:hypothetical protein